MTRILHLASQLSIVLAVVLLAVSAGLSTGAFTTADIDRIAGVQLGEDGDSLVGLDVTEAVSVACAEELVTITNNFDATATVEIAIPEHRDGSPASSEDGEGENPLIVTLTPGESTTVYVTDVRGPIHDDVEFEVTATTPDTSVTLSRSVPKVPGNEDGDDDGNRGAGGDCGDDDDDDDDDDEDDDEDDDDDDDDDDDHDGGGPPAGTGGPDE